MSSHPRYRPPAASIVWRALLPLLAWLLAACSAPTDSRSEPSAGLGADSSPVIASWEGVVAEVEGGERRARVEVRQADYLDWLAWRGLTAEPAHLQDFATALVLQRMAEARAAGLPEPVRSEAAERLRQQLLGEVLLARREQEIVVDEAAVEAAWKAVGGEEHRPRRWQLRNLFLRLPADPAAQVSVRERMTELREQLLAGADFATLAAEHSQSQTRFREGRLGLLPLDRLPPAVAKAVEPLQAGQLSEIVQTADGLSLFLCERVDEAGVLGGDALRDVIRKRLRRQAQTALPREFDADLLRSAGLQPGQPEARRRLPELRAQAAIEAGLLEDPSVQQQLRWRTLMQLAQTELIRQSEEQAGEPDEATLRAQFQRMSERGQSWQRFHVAAIDFGAATEETQAQARQIEAAIAAGELSFGEAAQAHSRDASAAQGGDLGWFTVRTLAERDWMMMRAVRQMAPGERSGLIHSGDRLWLYQLIEHQQGAEVRFEDVRDELARRHRQGRPRALQRKLRAEIAGQVQLLGEPSG
ncbi:MAG: peptidylprolyl isomerase [Xanthomonadales bacterium]|nr:peptidylprolyl isomerase [Xanthomonadales bacterium]MCB1633330.1 peptidylprolyl isomerase [Xanthomonadales bacterium]MCB1642686.1 peptidylprolyl isomerase [Xanthomonadales bacterium]